MQPLIVIGAGPVGLAIAKALGEAGLDYVQVEATDHVGGNWAHGVYTTAHIISSRKTTEYADFPSASQMRAYFESYADAFQLRPRIRFDTKVMTVTPVGPHATDGWDVTFDGGLREQRSGASGEQQFREQRSVASGEQQFTGSSVMVCCGRRARRRHLCCRGRRRRHHQCRPSRAGRK